MARRDGKPGRLAQIRQTYQMTKSSDPRIGWILLGWFLLPLAIAVVVSLLLNNWWLVPWFHHRTADRRHRAGPPRRTSRVRADRGTTGAAAAVLNTLGKWDGSSPRPSRSPRTRHRAQGDWATGSDPGRRGNRFRITNALRSERQREVALRPLTSSSTRS